MCVCDGLSKTHISHLGQTPAAYQSSYMAKRVREREEGQKRLFAWRAAYAAARLGGQEGDALLECLGWEGEKMHMHHTRTAHRRRAGGLRPYLFPFRHYST